MKKTLALSLLMLVFVAGACSPKLTTVPVPLPAVTEVEQVPVTESPTDVDQLTVQKSYMNSAFGLGFQFPSSWFGPEEYISDQTLRVEVGSDRVYPYGTDPAERIYELGNSYNIVIQYSKNDQNTYWKDTYQSLLNLKDGESLSDARSLIVRVKQLSQGGFEGIEYISTLSETAQTEPAYVRQVLLFDGQSNLLTIMGQPIDVEIGDGTNWRDVYRRIDEENLTVFHEIVESITINSTGLGELDKIIDVALRGNTDELKSLIRLTQTKCTFAEGLGGPPKCMGSEQERDVVEVLPILGSEGYFLQQAELESWDGLDVTALFAVYEVSESVYSDENYPAGEYAIVLINKEKNTSLTLQIDQGNIVRIDYGFEYPPSIPSENVVSYLIQPGEINP